MIRKFFLAVFLFLISTSIANAAVGVGVGTGKIEVTEKLKSGIVYKIPPVTVLNTGDESANYSVDIAYNENQNELKPDAKWFSFSPLSFHLDPGQVQIINVTLTLPLKVTPGKYFAYIEGFPVKKDGVGTTVGVAAASKLYFEVVPTNTFYGFYYRIVSLLKVYEPWPLRIAVGLFILAFLLTAKKFLNIEVNFKKTKNDTAQK